MSEIKNINIKTLQLFWQQVKKHKPSFFLTLIAMPTGAVLLDTFLPLFLSNVIGDISNNQSIYNNLTLAIFCGLFGSLFNFIAFQSLTVHEASIRSEISNKNFKQIINKDISFFTNTKLGALTSRFIDFGTSHIEMQNIILIHTSGLILSFISGIIIIFNRSMNLAIIFIIFIVLMTLEINWSINKRKIWREKRRDVRSKTYGLIADNFINSVLVKTFAKENQEIKQIEKLNEKHKHAFLKDLGFISSEGSLRVLLMAIIQIGLVYYGANLVANNQIGITTIIFILAYTQKLGSQIFLMSRLINGVNQAFINAEPLTKILSEQNHISDIKNAKELKINSSEIKFDKLIYQYPEKDINIIKDFNLTIKPGEKVGLVGHSGAGKSTLVHLLLRFFDPTNGKILIDNQDIAKVTQTSLRESIAFVPQDSILFHRSIKDNVSYSKQDATEAEIIKACKLANAWEFVKDLPDGLNTLVGERGVKLSGGQRQRVAIARAILKNSPILILDEATSALDSESEKLIQDSFKNLMNNRTSIVIAHRLSTIAKLDRIIVLDKGEIVEQGTHQELLDNNKTYANLWNHQSDGFIE